MKRIIPASIALIFLYSSAFSQNSEKIYFDSTKDKTDYYLAIRPASKEIKAAIVMLTSFLPPEGILTETKLQNTAYANEMLTVVVSTKQKLYADSFTVARLNTILSDIASRFSVNGSKFVLAGYDEAGNIALRYTEFANEAPSKFHIQPKAVFGIDSPVDLFDLWHWSENQIKKNYWQGAVGDAKYYLDAMTKENGTIYANSSRYKYLTPFYRQDDSTGNEKFLNNVAVRLYYDIDINWQLNNRRNSFYDTKIPDGSELIKRLLLSGNTKAELVVAKQHGVRSNGDKSPNAISIVDEVECIQWIKQSLDIFDPVSWKPPYDLQFPSGWSVERFGLPPDFAMTIPFTGIEDIRFAPGWGDTKSEEHWSYCFLWWLNGKPALNAENLESALKDYYTGLVGRNIISGSIPSNKIVPTVVTIKKIKTEADDLETYGGTIAMLDYHTQTPITLNCVAHVKPVKSANHSAIYFEISPKPSAHPVWTKMNQIGTSFNVK